MVGIHLLSVLDIRRILRLKQCKCLKKIHILGDPAEVSSEDAGIAKGQIKLIYCAIIDYNSSYQVVAQPGFDSLRGFAS